MPCKCMDWGGMSKSFLYISFVSSHSLPLSRILCFACLNSVLGIFRPQDETMSECTHKHIHVTSSSHVFEAGIKRPNFDERVAAATRNGEITQLQAGPIADAA